MTDEDADFCNSILGGKRREEEGEMGLVEAETSEVSAFPLSSAFTISGASSPSVFRLSDRLSDT